MTFLHNNKKTDPAVRVCFSFSFLTSNQNRGPSRVCRRRDVCDHNRRVVYARSRSHACGYIRSPSRHPFRTDVLLRFPSRLHNESSCEALSRLRGGHIHFHMFCIHSRFFCLLCT